MVLSAVEYMVEVSGTTTGYEVIEVTMLWAGQLVTVGAHDVMVTTSVT
jgi:hypothetical protein